MNADRLTSFLIVFPILLLSVAIHEFAHCWITDRLGDDTPRMRGRVTLNPLAHLDPLGTLFGAITVWSGFGIGWGKPSPMNPANFRHPSRDRMLSAAAGPLSNILQMLAWASAGLVAHSVYPTDLLLRACVSGVVLNAVLAMFNLLPIYPLDGHHVIGYLAPPSWRPIIDHPAWMLVLLALIFVPELSQRVLHPALTGLTYAAVHISEFLVGWPPLR